MDRPLEITTPRHAFWFIHRFSTDIFKSLGPNHWAYLT